MLGCMGADSVGTDGTECRFEHCGCRWCRYGRPSGTLGGYSCLCSPNSASALPPGFHPGAIRTGKGPRDWRSSDLPGPKSFWKLFRGNACVPWAGFFQAGRLDKVCQVFLHASCLLHTLACVPCSSPAERASLYGICVCSRDWGVPIMETLGPGARICQTLHGIPQI